MSIFHLMGGWASIRFGDLAFYILHGNREELMMYGQNTTIYYSISCSLKVLIIGIGRKKFKENIV